MNPLRLINFLRRGRIQSGLERPAGTVASTPGSAVWPASGAAARPDPISSLAEFGTDGVVLGGRPAPLHLVRHPRARRYLLRLLADGAVRVTIPRQGTLAGGRAFAARHQPWLEKQLALRGAQKDSQPDGQVWFRGEQLPIERLAPGRVRFGAETLEIPVAAVAMKPWVERHLRGVAAAGLPARARQLALAHGLPLRRVTVRNQRTRWGSCSSRGNVSLNWRLVQTPEMVRDYIILHELAHLRHLNHSTKFWQEVERLCPEYRQAERWLKANRGLLG